MRTRFLRVAAVTGLLLLAGGADAQQIFKCTDRQGRITYGDTACPGNSAKADDVTSTVRACVDEECEGRRQRETELARQRLREDKQALADMISQRRKAEAEYLEQVARLQAIKARQVASERTALNDPYGERWGYGWGLSGYPVIRPAARPPLVTRSHPRRLDAIYTSPPVSLRVR